MARSANLILIDSDLRRRASVSHALSPLRIHVEPFETIDELAEAWPRSGVVLIRDGTGQVRELIARMAACGEWFPIVAFHEEPTTSQVVQAILDGAVDYIAWPFDAAELAETLDRADSRAAGLGNIRLREALARSRVARLTDREREVLRFVANGLSNRLIGKQLSISPRTVEIHRANMLNKLGAQHTSEAIRIAVEAELALEPRAA